MKSGGALAAKIIDIDRQHRAQPITLASRYLHESETIPSCSETGISWFFS
jgi:hypothetical protein